MAAVDLARSALEIKPEELRRWCDPTRFQFETTAELPDSAAIWGQDRAVLVSLLHFPRCSAFAQDLGDESMPRIRRRRPFGRASLFM